MTNKKSTRRDNGTGTFVERKDGRIMGKIMVGHNAEGNPQFLYSYGKTEAEAKRKLKIKLQDYNDKRGIITQDISVKKWFTDWLINTVKPTLKPKSYDAKRRCVDKFIVPNMGGIKVEEVTPNDVQNLINDMISQGYSYSQISQVYNTINQRYKLAIEQRQIAFNPTTGVQLPKKLQHSDSIEPSKAMNPDEVKQLLIRAYEKYPCGTPVYPRADLIVLLLLTGMRVGEALALTWDDIDFDNRLISINKNLVTVKNEDTLKINPITNKPYKNITIIQNTPKTDCSYRLIPIGDNALQALQNIKSYNGKYKYIYANSKGNITSYRVLSRMLEAMIEHTDIKQKYSLHSLRHTFASLLFAQGVNDRYISEVLGHSSVTVTHKIYIHIINSLKNKEVNKALVNIDLGINNA